MLEKPDLQDQLILSRLQEDYGLPVTQVTFLPLGVDVNAAVYRVDTEEDTAYFLKVRKGAFDEATVAVPQFLKTQGIQAIIAPLETRARRLWTSLGIYKMILYPYIQGKNGYEITLLDQHWVDLGVALKAIHTARVPPSLRALIQRETYSPVWREIVREFQDQVESTKFDDPVAVRLATFMKAKRAVINHMVARAGQLALDLQGRPLEFVLCHSDVHPGNLLIETGEAGVPGDLYIVDWDNPIFAPEERDLMFAGAGMGSDGPREEALFYQGYSGNPGYGQTEVDRMALAYYRYERIIEDIAAFCQQLLLTDEGGEDREQGFRYFISNFLPNREVEVAYKTDL